MKKWMALLLMLIVLVGVTAYADSIDFSGWTDVQLRAAYQAIVAEAGRRGIALAESTTLGAGRYIVGQDIDAGSYVITCVSTDAEEMSKGFGSLGAALDGLGSSDGTSYTDIYASLGSMFASLDEGVKIEVIGDYGTVIKSVQLKKGESASLILEGKVALKISDGTCRLERK